jgi:toxin-antitoxin system PIN domain toxin
VWLALAAPEHVHHPSATQWWQNETGQIGFSRITQVGFLRLMTTAAAMDGKPLSMRDAWKVYDALFEDERVLFVSEPVDVDARFRAGTQGRMIAPKLWSDAWLLSFSYCAGGVVVTFDRALAASSQDAVLLS